MLSIKRNKESCTKKLDSLQRENNSLKTENSLIKQQLTEWQTYGGDILSKYNSVKSDFKKLELEHEETGKKLIEVVEELSTLKDVDKEDYSIVMEDMEDNDNTKNKTEDTNNVRKIVNLGEVQYEHLTCGECDFKAKTEEELMKHFNQPSCNIKMYRCQTCKEILGCDLAFRSENELKDHINHEHVEQHLAYCEECRAIFSPRDFRSELELQQHLKQHMKLHNPKEGEDELPVEEGQFVCVNCDFESNSEEAYKKHTEKEHQKTNPPKKVKKNVIIDVKDGEDEGNVENLKCTDCGLVAETARNLKNHKKFTCKDFNCEDCDFQTTEQSLLDQHISNNHRTNTGVEKKCFNCDFKFSNHKALMTHRKAVHPTTIVCKFFPNCDNGDECAYVHKVNTQVKMVVGDSPTPGDVPTPSTPPTPVPVSSSMIVCKICNEQFNSKHNLMSHRKQKHIESVKQCRDHLQNTCRRGEGRCWYKHENFQQPQAQKVQGRQNFVQNQQVQKTPVHTQKQQQFMKLMEQMSELFLIQ